MKRYKFEVVITEGNDEFWESLHGKNGCAEMQEVIERALSNVGWTPGQDDCTITLVEYTNK